MIYNSAMAQAGPSSVNHVLLNDPELVHLEVKLVGETEISYICGVKKSIRMRKVREKYAEAMRVPIRIVRFVYLWRSIDDNDTPAMLQMGNHGVILAYHDWS